MIRSIISVAGCVGLIAVPATAQAPTSEGAARIADQVAQCRRITADTERLACFDRSVAAFDEARSANRLRVVDREDLRKARRSLFGLSLPRINLFGDDKDAEPEIKQIDATIRSVRALPNGIFTIALDDGSQWQFTEYVTLAPKPGDAIQIKRGALGSYFGAVKNRVGQKIRRLG